MGYPTVTYKEEGMREGMQIEDASIPVEDKVRLLDALSETGLKHIVVGSFVSPRYTPQMAEIDEVIGSLNSGLINLAAQVGDTGPSDEAEDAEASRPSADTGAS